MLSLNILPAKHGDCLIVTYGPHGEHHVLIDGGPAHSYESGLGQYLRDHPDLRHIELMIVTHVDTDHVDGALCLLNDVRAGALQDLVLGEVWFNGYEQLTGAILDRGAKQGEYFTYLLRGLNQSLNEAFGGKAVYRDLANEIHLPGGATLTVLTPGRTEIERMRREWETTCTEAGYTAGDADSLGADMENRKMYNPQLTRGETEERASKRPGADASAPNGSSIGVLFEYDHKRILLAGDAHARTLAESIRRYNERWGVQRMVVDLFKLAHHGSVSNLTSELLDLVDCRKFVVSSNGDRFGHPDVECLRLIEDGARERLENDATTVYFNYAARMAAFKTHVDLRGLLRLEASNTIDLA